MNIRHECPLPDLSYAVVAPLFIQTADGTILISKKWSLAGIWIDPAGHDLTQGTVMAVPFQGVDISFNVKLAPTSDPEHFVFENLSVRQRETLSLFYQGVLSGKMVATGDMISSLDTPVDLVPMGETEEEKAAGVKTASPRLRRVIWNVVFYLFLAAFMVLFVGGHIWDRLSTIRLDHGRFVAPTEHYLAPDTGYIDRLYVRPGEAVARGDIIARLQDPDRESDVEEVRAEVLLAERALEVAQTALADHLARKPDYRAPLLEAVERASQLLRDHHPGTRHVSVALLRAQNRLQVFDQGIDVGTARYHALAADFTRQAEDQSLILRRWKRELRHRKSAANKYVIRAKTDGTVFAVHVEKGHFVGRGDLVAEVEEDTPRTAVGWLDDSMVTSVSLGMTGTAKFNFRGEYRQMAATVVDLQAGSDAARPDRFGMIVTLKIEGAGLGTSRKLFRPNAPAQLELDRDLFAGSRAGGNDAGS